MQEVPFAELDTLLKHFDDGYLVSHDEAYKRFAEVQLLPPDDLPDDPFSPEYRARYMDLYKKLSERADYSVENERCEFDVDKLTLRPYPYFTKSTKRAGQHYTLIGKLLEIVDLEPGSNILECGFGWGNTTLAFAMLGHHVTALDIEGKYCDLVERRAKLLEIDNVKTVNSDYLWVETIDEQFDAVVFFESFHHCWEFERLLRAIHRILKPGGKIYFGAEPINDGFTVPWGIRMDGESLYVARRVGWMELGFHSSFFDELLTRTGWRGECVYPHFWVAERRGRPIVIKGDDPRLKTQAGTQGGGVLRIKSPVGSADICAGLFGPYLVLGKGRYSFELKISVSKPYPSGVVFDVCCDAGTLQLYSETCGPAEFYAGVISGEFSLDKRVNDLETRLFVPAGFVGSVEQLSLVALD